LRILYLEDDPLDTELIQATLGEVGRTSATVALGDSNTS
jgi:hypothetical protein